MPKVVSNSTERDATDVKKYTTRWRTYNVTAEPSTSEQEWQERQAAVKTATQVCLGFGWFEFGNLLWGRKVGGWGGTKVQTGVCVNPHRPICSRMKVSDDMTSVPQILPHV